MTRLLLLLSMSFSGCALDWTPPEDAEDVPDAGEDAQGDEQDAPYEADLGLDGSEDHQEADLPQDEAQDTDDAGFEDTADDAGDFAEVETESGVSCSGPFTGEGRVEAAGDCMGTFQVGVYAGDTYTVSACTGPMVGNLVLAVYGACQCIIYEPCGGLPESGDFCTCTATTDGIMTICASAGDTSFVRWSYRVEGVCWDVG